MDTVKFSNNQVKIIAHRGLSGLECENTSAAFVAAANRSYHGIETDVHVTKDGKIIVFHDDNTLRMAGKKKIVEKTRYSSLKKMLLKNPRIEENRSDYYMPDLYDYISICKKYDKVAVLEIKNSMEEKYIHKIVDEIRENDYVYSTVFISFKMDNLIILRKLLPDAKIQFLTSQESIHEEIFETMKKYMFDLDIKYRNLTKEIIDRVHGMGLEVNSWTCDDKSDAERLVDMGVDTSPQIYLNRRNTMSIKDKKLFLMDMDGTLYLGDDLFEPALDFLTSTDATILYLKKWDTKRYMHSVQNHSESNLRMQGLI